MAVTTKDVCKTCEDLQVYSPDFVLKGVTDQMCENLKANTGLMNKGRENCTDLHNANDCLIGGIAEKAKSYNSCDPNTMIEDLAKNVMHVIDMLVCSDCGQWDQIEALWEAIEELRNAIKELHDLIKKLQDGISGNSGNITKMLNALTKILENLKSSGAWTSEGDILEGSFAPNRIIASGNINIFGGTPDGDYAIRTSNSPCENDLCGGI